MKLFLCLLMALFPVGFSCQSSSLSNGLQEKYDFYLAARIAFLPCMKLTVKDTDPNEFKLISATIDSKILEEFQYQPFVNGFSPSVVKDFLKKHDKNQMLTELKNFLLSHDKTQNPIKFYLDHIKNKANWLIFLKDLSHNVGFSDAIFLPLITHSSEKKVNKRGLLMALRTLELTLLLIEVETGELIWLNQRKIQLSNKHLIHPPNFNYPEYPSWRKFENKLIVKALWKKFPGWQY